MTTPTLKLPKVIGHRGAKAYAPENTLASIHTAADMGVEWIEMDVKLTKDGVPVMFHDDNLDRCTNLTGLMAETDFATVRELDAGSWFSESFIDEKIPTLEEALEVVIDRHLGFNLEIKPCAGREVETAGIVLDYISRIWDDDEDLDKLLISSFSHVSLETAKEIIPAYHRGLLLDEYVENWKEIAEYLNTSAFAINHESFTRAQIHELLEHSKPLMFYTVNDPIRAVELFEFGATSVFSDNPDVIFEEIESFH